MKHIVVTIPAEERHKRYLEEKGKDCVFRYIPAGKVTEEDLKDAQIILGNVPASLLSHTDRLEWLQLNSAGADQYCRPGILKPGTILTNATGAYGLAVSEYMVAVSFNLQNKLYQYYASQQNHRWEDHGKVTSVFGSVTLVVGLGDIGSEYAKRMKALGSYTIGLRRTAGEKPDYLDELYTTERLEDLLPKADFVALSLPSTPETVHIMDERRMRMMKPGAFLINAGRGNAIDTDGLCRVLQDGHLGGCAVDVTDPEPLPLDHPLWDAPRMLITPHISGQYHLPETFERIVRIFGENLEAYLSGNREKMRNQVNFQTGYRRK